MICEHGYTANWDCPHCPCPCGCPPHTCADCTPELGKGPPPNPDDQDPVPAPEDSPKRPPPAL